VSPGFQASGSKALRYWQGIESLTGPSPQSSWPSRATLLTPSMAVTLNSAELVATEQPGLVQSKTTAPTVSRQPFTFRLQAHAAYRVPHQPILAEAAPDCFRRTAACAFFKPGRGTTGNSRAVLLLRRGTWLGSYVPRAVRPVRAAKRVAGGSPRLGRVVQVTWFLMVQVTWAVTPKPPGHESKRHQPAH